MIKSKIHLILTISVVTCLSFAGCGGGGGGGGVKDSIGGSTPAKTLNWIPPSFYSDSSPLNPASDLDVFEVYIKHDGNFSSIDDAIATVGAFDPVTGQVTTTFNLASLSPFLSNGVTYYVSVRAVAKNGVKSDFSQPASFSF